MNESKFQSAARIKDNAENELLRRIERGLNIGRALWAMFAAIVALSAGAALFISSLRNDIESVRKLAETNNRLIRQVYKDRYGIEP